MKIFYQFCIFYIIYRRNSKRRNRLVKRIGNSVIFFYFIYIENKHFYHSAELPNCLGWHQPCVFEWLFTNPLLNYQLAVRWGFLSRRITKYTFWTTNWLFTNYQTATPKYQKIPFGGYLPDMHLGKKWVGSHLFFSLFYLADWVQ